MSRLYDIILNNRFCSWYVQNPQQAGFRKYQGCLVQIFALLLSIETANCLKKSLFIGLLDFEKGFGFMNRQTLMKDLMRKDVGGTFLKSINSMYREINYLPKISDNLMGEAILADQDVTQGRDPSANLFSFYISDMNEPLNDLAATDFIDHQCMLQLADDTIILAESVNSLAQKCHIVFRYAKREFIVVNMRKTRYMHLIKNPSLNEIKLDTVSIKPVDSKDGYNWLGFNLTYTSDNKYHEILCIAPDK